MGFNIKFLEVKFSSVFDFLNINWENCYSIYIYNKEWIGRVS